MLIYITLIKNPLKQCFKIPDFTKRLYASCIPAGVWYQLYLNSGNLNEKLSLCMDSLSPVSFYSTYAALKF